MVDITGILVEWMLEHRRLTIALLLLAVVGAWKLANWIAGSKSD